LYGGLFPVFKSSFGPPSQYAFVGEFEQRFAIGEEDISFKPVRELVTAEIEEAERLLMTYKAGRVIHDWISITFATPSPTGTLSMGIDGSPRPMPNPYELKQADLDSISERFRLLSSTGLPAMKNACQRLADAERRKNPVDSIVDAVVGLEMLLLSGSDRQGLRFRFALNYASLPEGLSGDQRKAAFREASDLYKIRSEVVHAGKSSDEPLKFGDEQLHLKEIAERGKGMLRSVIDVFLNLDIPAQPKERKRWLEDFWESKHLDR